MTARLLLLRHGEVASHRGDVPVTAIGLEVARAVGAQLAVEAERVRLLSGSTLRARQTADAIADGARSAGAEVDNPRVAFGLRNPDIYVAGERVEMVSSPAALAAQVPGLSEQQAAEAAFFGQFYGHPDRIGWWLRLPPERVPGEDAGAVARRVGQFAASLPDRTADPADLIVGVTHSPVLRACALAHLGHDPGEPEWVTGLELSVAPDRSLTARWYSPG